MRQETRLIKEHLKSKYPDKKFICRYNNASNYYDSSDKLTVICDRWTDVDEVVSFIRELVSGIKVFKKGEVATIYNRQFKSEILSLNGEWIEAGLMEFIEVANE